MVSWGYRDGRIGNEVMIFLTSIPDFVSTFVVPFFGGIVDTYGFRISWLLICSLAICVVHLSLGLLSITPIPAMVLLGFSYAIYGVIVWPSIAIIVQQTEEQLKDQGRPTKLLGTAFGISTSALNSSLTIVPLISAQIRNWGGSFVPVQIFYASLTGLGTISSLTLLGLDRYNGHILQLPATDVNDDDASSITTISDPGPAHLKLNNEPDVWENTRFASGLAASSSSPAKPASIAESMNSHRSFMSLDHQKPLLGTTRYLTRASHSELFTTEHQLVEEDELSIE